MKTPTIILGLTTAALLSIASSLMGEGPVVQPKTPFGTNQTEMAFIHGTLSVKTDSSLTIQPTKGTPIMVALSAETMVAKNDEKVTASEIAPGSIVTVLVSTNEIGKLDALVVFLMTVPESTK